MLWCRMFLGIYYTVGALLKLNTTCDLRTVDVTEIRPNLGIQAVQLLPRR